MPGTLFVVSTPIGNLEDITLRALRTLREVAVIAAEDTRRTAILLRRYEITTPMVSFHEHNERERTAELVRRLAAGEAIALVSDAGTPLVSDPGARLVRAAIADDVPVQAIPGPSAVMTALTVAGLATDRFTFLGFAPARRGERARWLQSVKTTPGTLVFFEAPHRIGAFLEDVRTVLGERQIVLARELTKSHEEVTRGSISEILDRKFNPRGEYTVLVSDQNAELAAPAAAPNPAYVVAEFGRMTTDEAVSARDAVSAIARRASMSKQDVYAALRRAGKIG